MTTHSKYASLTRFGTPEGNEKYDPGFLVTGYPDILRIGNAKENGKYTALFIQADPPPHAPTPFDGTRYERLMYRLTFGGRQIAGF